MAVAASAPEGRASLVDSCRRAADVLREADVLLLCAGAGLSADSGLALYQDIANVPAYREVGLTYNNVCQPAWLEEEPNLFYGFWGACFNDYRSTCPHRGYEILARWAASRFRETHVAKRISRRARALFAAKKHGGKDPVPGAFFAYTSNVDGHLHDFFVDTEIRECHGSCELWQCGAPDGACQARLWRAPKDLSFQVDLQTMEAAEALSQPLPAGACAPAVLNGEPAHVGHVRRDARPSLFHCWPPSDADEAVREAFRRTNRPTCPNCDAPARPAVLMFGDFGWVKDLRAMARHSTWLQAVGLEALSRAGAAWPEQFPAWMHGAAETPPPPDLDELPDEESSRPLRVAILEIGCGRNVPAVRANSETTASRLADLGAACSLVRVNPEHPGYDDQRMKGKSVQLVSLKGRAVECLELIDDALCRGDRLPSPARSGGLLPDG